MAWTLGSDNNYKIGVLHGSFLIIKDSRKREIKMYIFILPNILYSFSEASTKEQRVKIIQNSADARFA